MRETKQGLVTEMKGARNRGAVIHSVAMVYKSSFEVWLLNLFVSTIEKSHSNNWKEVESKMDLRHCFFVKRFS